MKEDYERRLNWLDWTGLDLDWLHHLLSMGGLVRLHLGGGKGDKCFSEKRINQHKYVKPNGRTGTPSLRWQSAYIDNLEPFWDPAVHADGLRRCCVVQYWYLKYAIRANRAMQ